MFQVILSQGVFSATTSHIIFDCSEQCTFENNQPTLFYMATLLPLQYQVEQHY